MGNIDTELQQRLERSVAVATRKCQRHFTELERHASKVSANISRDFDAEFNEIVKHASVTVGKINRELDRVRNTVDIDLNLDRDGALRDLRSTRQALQREAAAVDIGIDIDGDGASAGLRRTTALLQAQARANPIKVAVETDRKGGLKSLTSGLAGMVKGSLGAAATLGKLTALAGGAALALGSLVPVVGVLGAGLAAVGGAAGVVAVGGLVALGVTAAAVKTAFAGLDDVMKNMFDPEKAEQFEQALAKLSPAAQQTMRSVQRLGKAYADIVKTPVQETFFAGLGPKIDQLQRLLPSVRDSLVSVAQGFNDGANGALRMINSASGMSMVKSLLADAGNMGANLGAAVTGSIPGFLSLGAAATNVLSPMTDGIGSIARSWSETMLRMQQTGELQAKMQGILGVAKQIGAVLGQVGSAIGGVFRAASAAGQGNPLAGILGTVTKISDWINGPGQAALTSFFQSSTAAMGAILPVILQVAGVIGGTVAPIISQLAVAIGPVLQQVVGALGQGLAALQPAVGPLASLVGSIGAALTPVLPILGQLIAEFVKLAGPVLGSLASALGPILSSLGGALISVFQALQPAIAPVSKVFQALSPVIAKIASILGEVLASAITALTPVLSTVADVFSQILTAVQPLLPILGDILVQAVQLLAPLIQQMAAAWAQAVTSLLPLLPPLMQIVQALLPPLVQVIGALLPLMMLFPQILAALVPAFVPLLTILAKAAALVAQLVGGFLSFVATVLGAVVRFVTGVVTGFTGMVATVIATVGGWIAKIVGFFQDLVGRGVALVTDLWHKVADGFSRGVDTAVKFVQELPGKITGALSGAAHWLVDIGKKAIEGLISGIKSMLGSLGNAIVSIFPSIIRGPVKRALGLALGGVVPGLADGGFLGLLGGGEVTAASTTIRPGGFIVNAAATRRNRGLLGRLAPRGRVLSGPGTGTSDSITGTYQGKAVARVSRGEFYVPPEQAAGVMPLLWAINAGRNLAHMLAAGGVLPAFAPGGLVPSKLRDLARQATSSGYTWGGWGNGWNTDCSGLTSSLANMASGKADGPGVGERTATGGMAGFLQARGFQPGKGPDGSLRIGWSSTHAGAQLPTGEFIEHTGPEGAPAKFGSDAKDPAALGEMMHLPMGGDTDSGALGSGGASGGGGSFGSGGSGGGSTSYGNAGGTSSVSSVGEAKRSGLTPVWVENWPSNLGSTGTVPTGDYTASVDAGGPTAASSSKVDTIPLKKNPDGTYSSTDPEWNKLIQRESGGRADVVQGITDVNSGGNEASGLFQIAKSTWKSNGGTKYAPTAGEATPEQQAEVAAKIFNDQGGSPWGSGAGQNFGREDEAKLRAGIQRAGSVPTTPAGNVPVEIAGGDTPVPSQGTPELNTSGKAPSTSSVMSAENSVANAKTRVAQANDRLRIAEMRLDEVRANPKSKPSTIAAAEVSVKNAKTAVTEATNRQKIAEQRLTEVRARTAKSVPSKTTPTKTAAEDTTMPELSGPPSQLSGNVAAFIAKDAFAGVPELKKYADPAGTVANAAVAGQVSAALGMFGLDFEPRGLTAMNQYLSDNTKKGDQVTKKDLASLLQQILTGGFGAINVTINGEADGHKVAKEIDAERKKNMRRYVLT